MDRRSFTQQIVALAVGAGPVVSIAQAATSPPRNRRIVNQHGNVAYEVPVLVTDRPNASNRIYPFSVVQDALRRYKYYCGQIGMPDGGYIELWKLSHHIHEMWFEEWDGCHVLWARIIPLRKAQGLELARTLERDIHSVAFRTAGFAETDLEMVNDDNEREIAVVRPPFTFISVNALPAFLSGPLWS
jgi:hypothetical protein